MNRHVEQIKMQFRTTATLAALYANAHLPEGSKVTPDDFVPGAGHETGTPPEIESLRWKRFSERNIE